MRLNVITSLIVAAAFASCETVIRRDGMDISGHFREVSAADITAAIDAARQGKPNVNGNPRDVEVINRDEIHIHWTDPSFRSVHYDIVRRVRGRWRSTEQVVVTS